MANSKHYKINNTRQNNSKGNAQKSNMHFNARETALLIIIDVLENKKYLKDAREKHFFDLRKNGIYPDSRDRSFINSLSKGVVEKCLTLDYIIDSYSNIWTFEMEPVIRSILREATYELFFFDRTPDYSSINEAVNLTKRHGYTRLSGFVNGVLRNISRHKDELVSKINNNPKAEVKYSIPNEIFRAFEVDYGYDRAVKIAEAFELPETITARVITQKISANQLIQRLSDENIVAEKQDEVSIIIKDSEKILSSKAFRDGLFYIQDLSSMMVEREFLKAKTTLDKKAASDVKAISNVKSKSLKSDSDDNSENEEFESAVNQDKVLSDKGTSEKLHLLDLCSAPGGKSIDFADTYGERIDIISCDVSEKKTKKIKENIEKFSLSNIHPTVNDASVFNSEFENSFDIVLCDVPCSGLGTCSHRPEVKYRQSEAGFCDLRIIQTKIIENASKYVKAGGFLIYSTCTLNKEENDEIIEHFLTEHSTYKCIAQKTIFPDALHDGFFISILRTQ